MTYQKYRYRYCRYWYSLLIFIPVRCWNMKCLTPNTNAHHTVYIFVNKEFVNQIFIIIFPFCSDILLHFGGVTWNPDVNHGRPTVAESVNMLAMCCSLHHWSLVLRLRLSQDFRISSTLAEKSFNTHICYSYVMHKGICSKILQRFQALEKSCSGGWSAKWAANQLLFQM